jgi:DNA-binding transcriptional MocR family regulator
VLRAGSFSKSVAPGLRVGYLTAPAAVIEPMATSGLLDSGGGTAHFAGTVLAEYAAAGDFVTRLERFRAAYRERRDALLAGLEEHLPEGASWTRAGGGYFTWVVLPRTAEVGAVVEAASKRQMGFIPAGAFFVDRAAAPNALRLAFSMYPAADLAEAGRRLGDAIRDVG